MSRRWQGVCARSAGGTEASRKFPRNGFIGTVPFLQEFMLKTSCRCSPWGLQQQAQIYCCCLALEQGAPGGSCAPGLGAVAARGPRGAAATGGLGRGCHPAAPADGIPGQPPALSLALTAAARDAAELLLGLGTVGSTRVPLCCAGGRGRPCYCWETRGSGACRGSVLAGCWAHCGERGPAPGAAVGLRPGCSQRGAGTSLPHQHHGTALLVLHRA